MNKIVIYTDGAATMKCVNGRYERCSGGAAFAVVSEDLSEIYHSAAKHFDNTTNNYCELYAILMALEYCKETYDNKLVIEIRSDSAYCVNMLKKGGWIYSWVRNGWTRGPKHQPIENLDVIKQIYDLLDNKVKFVKVKGHSGEIGNTLVDSLAVAAKKNN